MVRSQSADDRRATLLAASPQGRELVQRYEDLKAQRVAPILAGHSPGTIDTLSDLLARFSLSLLDLGRPPNGYCLRCAAYVEDDCLVGRARGGCPYQRTREAHEGHGRAAHT